MPEKIIWWGVMRIIRRWRIKNFWELFREQWRYNLNGWEAYFVVDWPWA